MTDERITDWVLYPSGGRGGRSIGGEYVTITANGQLAISEDLMRAMPKETAYIKISYSSTFRKLRLVPVAEPVRGALKMLRPESGGTRRGVQGRVGTQAGFRVLGLVPKRGESYEARWCDGSIIVDLTAIRGEGAEDSVPAPVARDTPPVSRTRPKNLDANAGVVEGPPARSCGNCVFQQFRLCTNEASPHRRKVGPLNRWCIKHEFAGEKRATSSGPQATGHESPPPKRPRQGSRPREMCPQCHHEIPVTGKGFTPHDRNGVIYASDRGDREFPCPGSRTKPGVE